MSNIRRRVKLYVLNENRQWIDRGTGHVSTLFEGVDQRSNNRGIVLIVRSEENGERKYLINLHFTMHLNNNPFF